MNGHSKINLWIKIEIIDNRLPILQKTNKTMYDSDDVVIWKDLQVSASWMGL